jgi:hypothetical protein
MIGNKMLLVTKHKKKSKRCVKENVTENDYEFFKDLFLNSKCYSCNNSFTFNNKPILDRINNKLKHSKNNVLPTCKYCNSVKGNRDEKTMKLLIQLRKLSIYKNLPMTLCKDDEELYYLIRK